jgi:pyruvate carboxylase
MAEFQKILVANRGEIAIRILRAANEMGKQTVAVYAEEDKLGLHRFKADEAYRIGAGLGPVQAYLSIEEIIRVAKQCGADAIHPGYGLLSENPDFVDACDAAGITFIGPKAETMRALGDKASARMVSALGPIKAIRQARDASRLRPVFPSFPQQTFWVTTWTQSRQRRRRSAIHSCSRPLGAAAVVVCAPSKTPMNCQKRF